MQPGGAGFSIYTLKYFLSLPVSNINIRRPMRLLKNLNIYTNPEGRVTYRHRLFQIRFRKAPARCYHCIQQLWEPENDVQEI